MGDTQKDSLRVDFDRHIKRTFHGSTVTRDAGLLAYRELDALGLSYMFIEVQESRGLSGPSNAT
jgi:hypothetical protein